MEELVVIVEVKGIWHDKVRTAMEDQLLDQYLLRDRATHRHGVYLVCWFDQESWDEDGYRRDEARKRFVNVENAREILTRQARELSDATGAVLKAFVLDLSLARPRSSFANG